MKKTITASITTLFFFLVSADNISAASPGSLIEAQLLALDISGELRPPAELTERIFNDLVAIRTAFPQIEDIAYLPKTLPDEIMVGLTDQAYTEFKNSQYHALDELNSTYGVIKISRMDSIHLIRLKFNQVYNTVLLSNIYLQAHAYGVRYVEPNWRIGDGSTISASPPFYNFVRAWGDCPAGCIYHQRWRFRVVNGHVQLIEVVPPPSTRRVPSSYPTIQSAIDASINGDTVIVAPGTYIGYGNRDIDFKGKKITVRSTNPNDPNIIASTIIDCNGTAANPHRGFYFHSGETASSRLSGMTIILGYATHGGGIYCNGASPTITNNVIANNTASSRTITPSSRGGGISCINSSAIILNNLIVWNYVRGLGGGICSDSASIINNTITNNFSSSATFESSVGGIYCTGSSSVVNTIIWGNSGEFSPKQIWGCTNITYSDIEGGYEGEGNINVDPCFVDPNNDNYHLLPDSLCINVGDPCYPYDPNETDLDGLPRIIGGRVDMGAFEFLNHPPLADAGPDQTIEAQAPCTKVTLNGSNSSDEDSTPGTNDDIVQFDWYEQIDPCDPNTDILLGTGQTIDCNLPFGSHTIILEVTDKAGASDTNETIITVQDTTPPTITCPADITLEGTCPAGAVATFAATATDLVDPQPSITYSTPSGSMFPLGSTPVTCTTTDTSGNSANCTFNVTVVDTTPPQFTLSVTPTILWPLNKRMLKITPAWTVTDLCDPDPNVSLVNIQISEPGTGDIQTDPNGSICLRAWRSGTGSSRVYTITFQAIDDSNNIAQCSATVTVPHDQRRLK